MSKEKTKYQVNITNPKGNTASHSPNNKVDPSKYKNFDKVYKSYSDSVYKKRWYRFQFHKSKNRKFTLYIMVVLIVAALVLIEYLRE